VESERRWRVRGGAGGEEVESERTCRRRGGVNMKDRAER